MFSQCRSVHLTSAGECVYVCRQLIQTDEPNITGFSRGGDGDGSTKYLRGDTAHFFTTFSNFDFGVAMMFMKSVLNTSYWES